MQGNPIEAYFILATGGLALLMLALDQRGLTGKHGFQIFAFGYLAFHLGLLSMGFFWWHELAKSLGQLP